MKKIKFLLFFLLLFLSFFLPSICRAMPPGTLLYRTSSGGKMFGYSGDPLLGIEKRTIKQVNSGHVAIYIGQENGIDYVVEALGGGIVKTPAKYFVNFALGEKFLGAKIPRGLNSLQQAKAVALAKSLAGKNLAYDLSFKKQKGPGSGQWTCVGLTEKIYESANISNPNNLGALEYDPRYYALNITPDGYDNQNVVNDYGDCFAKDYEFSKIARRTDMLLPAPEIIGYDAGLEHDGDRYIFLPYTQFIQPSLADVIVDINISDSFNDEAVRGKIADKKLALRWSLINNPLSSLKTVAAKVQEIAVNLKNKIFGANGTAIVLNNELFGETKTALAKSAASSSKTAAKKTAVKKTTDKKTAAAKVSAKKTAAKRTTVSRTIGSKTGAAKKNNAANSSAKKMLSKTASDAKSVMAKPKTTIAKNTAAKKNTSETSTHRNSSHKISAHKTSTHKTSVHKNPAVIVDSNPDDSNSEIPPADHSNNADNSHHNSDNNSGNAPDAPGENANATSSEEISGETDTATSSDTNVAETGTATSSETGTATSTATSTAETGTDNTDNNGTTEPVDWQKLALIKRIYSTGNNDWVELFNPTDYDFDLSSAGYRLEKTKTAVAPSLLMRIGDLADGSYPGGTSIKAHDNYLIVRDDANNFYKNQADAIATRDEFTWSGSGYTIYLGDGVISSSSDADIVDAVGFGGDATYFLGSGPAPEITDNYILTRVASTSDNARDFSLFLSDEPGLLATGSTTASTSTSATSTPPLDTPNWEAYLAPAPINSDGIGDLWHFDECYGGNIKWGVGKFGCALELNPESALTAALSPAYDLDNFSLSFNYKKILNSRVIVDFSNSYNEKLSLLIENGLIAIEGLPESKWRYFQDYMNSDSWRQATLVVSRADHYWALYIDGEEKIRETFSAALPNMENLKVWSNQGQTLLDEFALWSRVLSPQEIKNNYDADAPFAPVATRETQKAPVLKYFWNFDEGHGSTSLDNVSGLNLNIPEGVWDSSGRLNTAVVSKAGKNLSVDLKQPLSGKDYSLSFWWRNSVYPADGRLNISLRKDNKQLFGFIPNYFRNSYWFNNNYGVFHEGIGDLIPYDDSWHHLALTYDSYRYSLNFYVDGALKASSSLIFLADGNDPDHLDIISDSDYSEIDELGVWEGALSAGQIKTLFDNTPQFQ